MKKLVLTTTALVAALSGMTMLPLTANARLGDGLEALKQDRIMKALLMDKDVKPPLTQMRVYEVRPQVQQMKDNIYMKLQFDANEKLAWAELWISDEYRKLEPVFAKHFAGLFLHTQLDVADTASIRSLMTELQFREENPQVQLLGEVPKLPKESSAPYKAIIAKRNKYEAKLKKSRYSINTIKEKKRTWTKIRVEPK